uniref:Uncharacterized protein n=1 Tax=Oryza glumipatula TaxID=40148 RepID=A0A0D9Z1B9_9ORYZ
MESETNANAVQRPRKRREAGAPETGVVRRGMEQVSGPDNEGERRPGGGGACYGVAMAAMGGGVTPRTSPERS